MGLSMSIIFAVMSEKDSQRGHGETVEAGEDKDERYHGNSGRLVLCTVISTRKSGDQAEGGEHTAISQEEKLSSTHSFDQTRAEDGGDPVENGQTTVDPGSLRWFGDPDSLEYGNEEVLDNTVAGPLSSRSEHDDDQKSSNVTSC